jgi:hypothetical protein
MAISVNWGSKVIFVPQADLTFISAGYYELDLNVFWAELHDLQDSENGIVKPDIFSNNPEVTFSGLTLPRVLQIINGYTVEFEDGQYVVTLVDANSNVTDVRVFNQVSIQSQNSAGLVKTISEADLFAMLQVINQGVQDSSLLIPHTTDLPSPS